MNEIKHLPKSLPKENPFFELNVVGELTKQPYDGRFESVIPNMRIQSKLKKYVAFLNGGFDATLDAQTLNLHRMTAYCKFCLVDCPQWFKDSDYGLDLYDINVLEEVYGQILSKEQEWVESIHGKSEVEGEQKGE